MAGLVSTTHKLWTRARCFPKNLIPHLTWITPELSGKLQMCFDVFFFSFLFFSWSNGCQAHSHTDQFYAKCLTWLAGAPPLRSWSLNSAASSKWKFGSGELSFEGLPCRRSAWLVERTSRFLTTDPMGMLFCSLFLGPGLLQYVFLYLPSEKRFGLFICIWIMRIHSLIKDIQSSNFTPK